MTKAIYLSPTAKFNITVLLAWVILNFVVPHIALASGTFSITWNGSSFASTTPTTGGFCITDYPYEPSWGVYATGVVPSSLTYSLSTWPVNIGAMIGQTDGHGHNSVHNYMLQDCINGANPVQYSTFHVNDDYSVDVVNLASSTRVITTYPVDTSVIATSSAPVIFDFVGYVIENDWNSSSVYSWTLSKSRVCGNPLCTYWLPSNTVFIVRGDLDTHDANFTVSKIKEITELGRYYMFISFTKGTSCLFGFCLSNEITYSTTTSFVLVATTTRDRQRDLAEQKILELTGASDESFFDSCKIGGFNLFDCAVGMVGYLFIPSNGSELMQSLHDNAFSHAPLGYATRFVSIVTGEATTTLPSLTVAIPNDIAHQTGAISTAQLDLTPWNYLMGSTSYMGTATSTYTGLTMYDTLSTGWTTLCLALFGIAIMHDLYGMRHHKQIA